MRIAFVDPHGAGKSTQAKWVARSLPRCNHSPRFPSGDLFGAEVEVGTELGRENPPLEAQGLHLGRDLEP